MATIQAATDTHSAVYEPSSKWVLDYAEERCTLARNFGSGAEVVFLRIDSFGSETGFRLTLAGKGVPQPGVPAIAGSYRLTSDPEDRDVGMFLGTLGEDKLPAASLAISFLPYTEIADGQRMSTVERQAYLLRRNRPEPAFDARVDSIRIGFGKGRSIELHLENMAKPIEAMRACIDDLYKSWGMDPQAQRSLSRLAQPLPSTLKHVQKNYPDAALMRGVNAIVPVRLLIDANGAAKTCVVQSPDAPAEFKQAVCDNLSGKFAPALDAAGEPVASMYNTTVQYLIH
jgi:hypothetical protein